MNKARQLWSYREPCISVHNSPPYPLTNATAPILMDCWHITFFIHTHARKLRVAIYVYWKFSNKYTAFHNQTYDSDHTFYWECPMSKDPTVKTLTFYRRTEQHCLITCMFFCPRGKTLSRSRHWNWTVLQPQQKCGV